MKRKGLLMSGTASACLIAALASAAPVVKSVSPAEAVKAGTDSHTINREGKRTLSIKAGKALPSPRMLEAGAEGLVGFLNYSDYNPTGIYRISPEGEATKLRESTAQCRSAVSLNGIYYNFCIKETRPTVEMYDINDNWSTAGEQTVASHTLLPYCAATDGTTVWGTFDDGASHHTLGVLDTSGFSHTPIGELQANLNSLAADSQGNLYGFDLEGNFYSIDPATATMTYRGYTDMEPCYTAGAAFSPDGRLYWMVNTEWDINTLVEVNTANGSTEELCTFYDDTFAGLAFPSVKTQGVPQAPSDMVTAFTEGNLQGKVSFTMPVKDIEGNALGGSLQYILSVNGTKAMEGMAQCGARVTLDTGVAQAGTYTIGVSARSAAGTSPVTEKTLFIGNDTPLAPDGVQAFWEEGQFQVLWNSVTAGVNGGYVDPAAVTYCVRQWPGGIVLAQDTPETEINGTLAEPDDFTNLRFSVEARFAGNTSDRAWSDYIPLGAIRPPYNNPFDKEQDLEGCTVIDGNGDGKVWEYNWYRAEQFGCVRVDNSYRPAKDDWLILPPVWLEAGKVYEFSLQAAGYNHFDENDEHFEVMTGNAPVPEALTTEVIGDTNVTLYNWTTFSGRIIPATTGKQYIGIHATSAANSYYLNVINTAVSAPLDGESPGEVTALTLTSPADGSLKATVAFTAPSVTVSGKPLAELNKIDVMRNGFLVKTFEHPSCGAALTFEDTLFEAGDYTYTVRAANAFGLSPETSETIYVGYRIPAAPGNVVLVENDHTGNCTATWSAPSGSIDGLPLDPSVVTYDLYDTILDKPIATDISGTSHTWQAVTDGSWQRFMQVTVKARTPKGESMGTDSEKLTVGHPYSMPYGESFAGGVQHSMIDAITTQGEIEWGTWRDGYLGGICSQDGDNGFIAAEGKAIGDKTMFYTGKIDLRDAVRPDFTFWTYNIFNGTRPDPNRISVLVRDPHGDGTWTELLSEEADILCKGVKSAWKPVRVPLDAYKGKVVNLAIGVEVGFYTYTPIDNLRVEEALERDLGIAAFEAPERTVSGQPVSIAVTVRNNGRLTSDPATVTIFRNSEGVVTLELPAMESDAEHTLVLNDMLNVTHPESNTYRAVIDREDGNPANNSSEERTVRIKQSHLPVPEDVVASVSESGTSLSWRAPDMGLIPGEVSDGFEDCEPWIYDGFGSWTVSDRDDAFSGGFQGVDIPGLTPGRDKSAFFVFDDRDVELEGVEAHSGHRMAVTMFRMDNGGLSDWLVSPQLFGQAQTLSFWARSMNDVYRESIEVHVSDDGTAAADFRRVGAAIAIPAEWTFYSFELPAGSEYFALHSCASGSMMLMVDDLTYTPLHPTRSGRQLEAVGYNVYCNGSKLNDTPVEETAYIHNTVSGANGLYHVSAVYNTGEESMGSAASTAGAAAATERVFGVEPSKGSVTVSADGGLVEIFDTWGRRVFGGTVAGSKTIGIAPGVYTVLCGSSIRKVIVP